MRILGLDVGDRTIGVAVSDALKMTAQGVETIRRKTLELDLVRLQEIIADYEVSTIVVGYPKNMNGTVGPRGEFTEAFCTELEKTVPNIPIRLWDERLSTVAAQKSLIAADVSRAKRKKVIDKMAAVFILQGYLDSI